MALPTCQRRPAVLRRDRCAHVHIFKHCFLGNKPKHVVHLPADYRPTPLVHYGFPSGGKGLYLVRPKKTLSLVNLGLGCGAVASPRAARGSPWRASQTTGTGLQLLMQEASRRCQQNARACPVTGQGRQQHGMAACTPPWSALPDLLAPVSQSTALSHLFFLPAAGGRARQLPRRQL